MRFGLTKEVSLSSLQVSWIESKFDEEIPSKRISNPIGFSTVNQANDDRNKRFIETKTKKQQLNWIRLVTKNVRDNSSDREEIEAITREYKSAKSLARENRRSTEVRTVDTYSNHFNQSLERKFYCFFCLSVTNGDICCKTILPGF